MFPTLFLMSGLAQALTPVAPQKPSETQTALFNALKVRHEAPLCSSLADLSENVADDLVWLVDNAKLPPWVGIRAAQCVVREHTEAKADTIDTWVSDPKYKGVAMLTFGLLDELPEAAAIRFTTIALESPMADEARKRLADSAHLSVANLVNPSPDEDNTDPADPTEAPQPEPSTDAE